MRKQILPAAEIERNKRVRELMMNKIPRSDNPSLHLTPQEFDEMKDYMKKGYTREESIKIIRTTNNILNKYQ